MVGGRARKPSKRALEAQTTEELFRDDPERKDDPAKDDDVEFVRKRSKTVKTSNKGPRKRGKLRQLSEMPIEIVCSVLEHVDHQTLYSLTTVSKAMRALVLSAPFEAIWHRAEEELGLAELEQPMTRLQLAHLLWAKMCCFCGSRDHIQRLWHLKRILCYKCVQEKTILPSQISKIKTHCATQSLIEPVYWEPVNEGAVRRHVERYKKCLNWNKPILKSYVKWLDDKLNSEHKPPADSRYSWNGGPWDDNYLCFMRTKYEEYPRSPELSALIQDTKDYNRDTRSDGYTLQRLENRIIAAKQRETDTFRGIKKAEIERRLREHHGWSDADFTETDWEYYPPKIVERMSELTDKTFEKMLPKLIKWREEQREIRETIRKQQEEKEEENGDPQNDSG